MARELIASDWTTALVIAAVLVVHEVLTYDEVRSLVERVGLSAGGPC